MANVIKEAVKGGAKQGKVKGYEASGGSSLRQRIVTGVKANFSDGYYDLGGLAEMILVEAIADTEITFWDNDKAVVTTATIPADIAELEARGIINLGLDSELAHTKVLAGQSKIFRRRREQFLAVKGNCIVEAW